MKQVGLDRFRLLRDGTGTHDDTCQLAMLSYAAEGEIEMLRMDGRRMFAESSWREEAAAALFYCNHRMSYRALARAHMRPTGMMQFYIFARWFHRIEAMPPTAMHDGGRIRGGVGRNEAPTDLRGRLRNFMSPIRYYLHHRK